MGSSRAAVIRKLIRWYLRKPGGKLPERPAAGPWSEDKEPSVEE